MLHALAAIEGRRRKLWCVWLLSLACGCSLIPNGTTGPHAGNIEEVEKALLPIASAALDAGQMHTAQRLYRRLLDVDPESFTARMGLGNIAFKERRSEDAARWYRAARAKAVQTEDLHEALLSHGRAALETGKLEEARNSFERLAAEDGTAPTVSVAWALNGIGLTRLLEGNLPAAVRHMEQATRKLPSERKFAENLDRAYRMLVEYRDDQRDPSPDRNAELLPPPVEVMPTEVEPAVTYLPTCHRRLGTRRGGHAELP